MVMVWPWAKSRLIPSTKRSLFLEALRAIVSLGIDPKDLLPEALNMSHNPVRCERCGHLPDDYFDESRVYVGSEPFFPCDCGCHLPFPKCAYNTCREPRLPSGTMCKTHALRRAYQAIRAYEDHGRPQLDEGQDAFDLILNCLERQELLREITQLGLQPGDVD
jgi:hypothetical protein